MANAFSVVLRSAADDGTNTYCFIEITNGTQTMPLLQVTFPSGTTAATIQAYLQTIANTQPTLDATIGTLVNTIIRGA
jgi:hypothetical protein